MMKYPDFCPYYLRSLRMDEAFADEGEVWLEFVVALKSLCQSTHISVDDRLVAVDEACTLALGGSVIDAKEFVERQVVLGLGE
jgi:hypothetical protein